MRVFSLRSATSLGALLLTSVAGAGTVTVKDATADGGSLGDVVVEAKDATLKEILQSLGSRYSFQVDQAANADAGAGAITSGQWNGPVRAVVSRLLENDTGHLVVFDGSRPGGIGRILLLNAKLTPVGSAPGSVTVGEGAADWSAGPAKSGLAEQTESSSLRQIISGGPTVAATRVAVGPAEPAQKSLPPVANPGAPPGPPPGVTDAQPGTGTVPGAPPGPPPGVTDAKPGTGAVPGAPPGPPPGVTDAKPVAGAVLGAPPGPPPGVTDAKPVAGAVPGAPLGPPPGVTQMPIGVPPKSPLPPRG
jgi:hypothetical protein